MQSGILRAAAWCSLPPAPQETSPLPQLPPQAVAVAPDGAADLAATQGGMHTWQPSLFLS